MKSKNKYKIIIFTTVFLICLIVIYLSILSHKETNKIYAVQTKKNIINLKKDFLKDTIDNIFTEIDRLRVIKTNNYKKNVEVTLKSITEEEDLSQEEFIAYFIERFETDEKNKLWTAFLWNETTGEILYHSLELNTTDIESTKENLKTVLSSFGEIEKGEIKAIFGVSKVYIDEIVKLEMGDLIRSSKFSNDSYIWVNEVLDFEGGEDYAIRRIHPYLTGSEGQYLSTNTHDIAGNLPYLEELEGINEKGELFYTYYFKKINSTVISKKITYAKLYTDYNWIIAMGVHLDDIDTLIEMINKEMIVSSNKITVRLIIYIFTALFIGFTILYFAEKKHLLHSTRSLQKELDKDTLTKALSRICGERNLEHFYKQYRLMNESPAIMMIDVDDFKQINDQYGHDVGDITLIEIVNTINHLVRSSDQLIRWGGDEFVGIMPGLRQENGDDFIEKIVEGISSIEIFAGTKIIKTSISIGLSYFNETDTNYNEVIKRADEALYTSKSQGKSKGNIRI